MPRRDDSRERFRRRDRSRSRSHRKSRRDRSRSRRRSPYNSKKYSNNINKYKDKSQENVKNQKDENSERSRRKAKAALLVMLENEEKLKKASAQVDNKNKLDVDFLSTEQPPEPPKQQEGKDDPLTQSPEEEDPLDAYMKEIEKDATIQDYQMTNLENTLNTNKIATLDDLDKINENEEGNDEKFHKDFLQTVENITKDNAENNLDKGDIIYQEDAIEFLKNDGFANTEEQWKKMKLNSEKAKELKPVNHNEINYEPFRKNLYIESPEVSKMTMEEVAELRRKNGNIKVRGNDIPKPVFNWYHCGLNSTIMQILSQRDIVNLFPIQMQAIPAIMSGRDVIGIAETGSGKTLSYVLPMLRHVLDQRPLKDGDGPIGLVLVPTRELAIQVFQEIRIFTKFLNLNASCIFGGSAIGNQISELRRGSEIVVATPGRFIEILCLSNGKITNLRRVTYVVLDEADRMLDLGFEPQIARIVANIRPDRQTVMFSATFPRQIESLAKKLLKYPIEIIVGFRGQTSKNVEQHVEIVPKEKTFIRLLELLTVYSETPTIIFTDSQEEATELWKQLFKQGYMPVVAHGGMDQEDRIDAIEKFKRGNSNILISTSVSSRGIDTKNCGLVVNFRCPNHLEDYIHRIGRTGRAGNKGVSFTFISPDDEDHLAEDILKALELSGQEVPEELRILVRNYKMKVKNGEAERFKVSGYLGRGYQFSKEEDEKNQIERKLLGAGYSMDEVDESEIEKQKQRLKLLEKDPNLHNSHSTALTLRAPSIKERHETKMKMISNDPKARQIAIDVGMNAAKAAYISGKTDEETLPIVQEAISKALANYKPIVSLQKGVQNAAKIIEDWEEKENIKNHIYTCEFEINDYPVSVRLKGTKKDYLRSISEVNDVDINVKGVFVEPGKKIPVGQKKMYILIKGVNQSNVNSAFRELKRNFDETALSYYTSNSGYSGALQRYSV